MERVISHVTGCLPVLSIILLILCPQCQAIRKIQTQKAIRCWCESVTPIVMHYCFKDLCRCNRGMLDCSSNWGNLTYVPRVMDNVQVLNFSNNQLARLPHGFFLNVSATVWLLDLYNNGLTHLADAAFTGLPRLDTLLIGGNHLSYTALAPVWNIPTLRKLVITCGALGPIPLGLFVDTPMAASLQHLDLSWNDIRSFDMTELQPLQSLKNLSVWTNGMYELKTAYLPSLLYMHFHNNILSDFPQTCLEVTGRSLFPNLTELHLDFNEITEIQDPVCLPRLRILDLKYNHLANFLSGMFIAQRFPVLMQLAVNQMGKKLRTVESFVFNNSALNYLSFGLNGLDFSTSVSVVDEDVFGGLPNLRVLFLDQNNFQLVTDMRMHRLLRRVPRLERLYLGGNKISQITSTTFSVVAELKELYLYQNSLTTIPDGAFDRLDNLRVLELNNNRLPFIPATAFDDATSQRLQLLDMSGNPFQCGCDILWFQGWLKQSPGKFQNYRNQGYRCVNVDNTTVRDFYLNDQACILSSMTSVLIIVFTSLILLSLAAFSLCFGYRWHCRLWLYEIFRERDRRRRHIGQQRRLTYDVFVAYAEEDVDWVLEELLPVLEGQWGLRLCIHQRDFIPGKHIIDNISDCVDESDKLLMVFSPHFARSEWCQFELKMCQACVMDRDDVLVLLTLQETMSRDLTGAMLAVMRTTTYIEWDDCPNARTSFWGRLRIALRDVIQTVRNRQRV